MERKKYNKAFRFEKSGLIIFSFGNDLSQFYIRDVIPNSPAHFAGLREGDVILKINGWSYKLWQLSTISKKLSKNVGKKINIKINRNGEKMMFKFKLQDYLESN